MAKNTALPLSFKGFTCPHYTMVPDELFDELLVQVSGAELKVLLYIIRRTFGFKRDRDRISLAQMLHGITAQDGHALDHGVGLSKPTLLQALRSLQAKGMILAERQRSHAHGDEPTVYRLRFAEPSPTSGQLPPVVKKLNQGGGQKTCPPPWSKNLTTQQTAPSTHSETFESSAPINTRSPNPAANPATDHRSRSKSARKEASVTPQRGAPTSSASIPNDLDSSQLQIPTHRLEQMRAILTQKAALPLTSSKPPEHANSPALPLVSSSPQSAPTTPDFGAPTAKERPSENVSHPPPAKRSPRSYTHHAAQLGAPDPLWVTMQEFSQDLGDQAPNSTLTWVVKHYHASGLSADQFMGKLYTARSITRSAPHITTHTPAGGTNRTPYFKQVLLDELRQTPKKTNHAFFSPHHPTQSSHLKG